MELGKIQYRNLPAGQRVAVKYFVAAMVLFLAQIVFGSWPGCSF